MHYIYQTNLYISKSSNRKTQAITMTGNSTNETDQDAMPTSISAPGRRLSSLSSEDSKSDTTHQRYSPDRTHTHEQMGTRSSTISVTEIRRSTRASSFASIIAYPAPQPRAPIAPMFPAHPNPPVQPADTTPSQVYNTVPNIITGPQAPASTSNKSSMPKMESSLRTHTSDPEAEYRETADEDTTDDDDDDMEDIEEKLAESKRRRDSLVIEFLIAQAREAADAEEKEKGKAKEEVKVKVKEEEKEKAPAPSGGDAGVQRVAKRRRRDWGVVGEDAPARNTRSLRAGRGGAEFGFGALEGVVRRRGRKGKGRK